MKLISMKDFVLEQGKKTGNDCSDLKWIEIIINYANFLNQPLTLGMFVPCGFDGNIIELPPPSSVAWSIDGKNQYDVGCEIYQQAKERVLFEGFDTKFVQGVHEKYYTVFFNNDTAWISWNESKKVEDLLRLEPTLTPTAIKQIGL
jgi:hypothetical protein